MPVTLGSGVYEILTATIRPVSSTGLGISNVNILVSWESSEGTKYTYLGSGFASQFHSFSVSQKIVVGPCILMGWIKNYATMARNFEVIYRRLVE